MKFPKHNYVNEPQSPEAETLRGLRLENELHKAFNNKKVNMLKYRKEFFNVSLDEIEQQIKIIGIDAEFSRLPEAMEYRETLAILEKYNSQIEHKTVEDIIAEEFPSTLKIDAVTNL
ncbi:MAG: GIY-YIG nuclease family protein [Bacteroidetes bacterium]|nr:GIY-YIG nuclease family protein [Bacteroidota bacterium]MBP6314707.1 GIY-YIG nuclease family protein [Chitinophagaceae bacterium]